jgi:hypothetical protein
MNRKLTYILLLAVIAFSCKKEYFSFRNTEVDIANFKVAEIDFEFLSTKTKFQYTDSKNSNSATANIRIKKDSIIWFSLTPALGIEAARGIITQDSMIIVDRLNKTYSVFTFKELSNKFRIDMDYNLLQSLLLGNAISEIKPDNKLRNEGDFFKLTQIQSALNIENLVNNKTLKIERVTLKDALTSNSMAISYSDFWPVDSYLFSNQTSISINYKIGEDQPNSTTEIVLEHSKVEIETKRVKFPFNIPSKYELK